MGARQSKRSVDITTGKEALAEGGEVAAAGGEGKLERIEDVDALKPQLNGDAAHEDLQISDKEKKMQQQDEAVENAKDTNNEKEIILSPVVMTNGDSKAEGDASEVKEGEQPADTPEPDSNKKPKKVKKKWSFRSISFSKKDKQKPAKKEKEELTNGECDKVPEEATDVAAAPAGDAVEAKAEVPVVEKEAPKADDSEKTSDKAPETPVTEPLTNGSSAPETPKDEIRQNGDSVSIEEPLPAEVEAKSPEPAKTEEKVESPVDALPMNGLKIEETPEEKLAEVEVPPPQKLEEVSVPEAIAPEPVEELPPVIAEPEVCVAAAQPEGGKSAEVAPPPLPSCPPPSSLTMFAEKTMAPHLVDTQVVASLPVVDVDASLVSGLAEVPAVADASAPLVCDKPSDKSAALPAENSSETVTPSIPPASEIIADVQEASQTVTPSETTITVDEKIADNSQSNDLPSVDNLAVVSSNENVIPEPSNIVLPPVVDPNILSEVKTIAELDVRKVPDSVEEIPAPFLAICPAKPDLPSESEMIASLDLPSPFDVVSVASKVENVESSPSAKAEDMLPPPIEESLSTNVTSIESPVFQRGPSDPDLSEATLAEPPSDSFPPPPPPESCPESMTELSVSESLPPPMSESSQLEAVPPSPPAEAVDVASPAEEPKPSPMSEVATSNLAELSIPPPAEMASETVPAVVAAPAVQLPAAPEQQLLASAIIDEPQVVAAE